MVCAPNAPPERNANENAFYTNDRRLVGEWPQIRQCVNKWGEKWIESQTDVKNKDANPFRNRHALQLCQRTLTHAPKIALGRLGRNANVYGIMTTMLIVFKVWNLWFQLIKTWTVFLPFVRQSAYTIHVRRFLDFSRSNGQILCFPWNWAAH